MNAFSYKEIMDSITMLKQQLTASLEKYKKVNDEVSSYAVYRLTSYKIRNNSYYTKVNISTQDRTYLGNDKKPEVRAIQNYHFTKRMIEMIERDLQLVTLFLSEFADISFDAVMKSMPGVYRQAGISLPPSGSAKAEEWKKRMLEIKSTYKPYRPEGLIHKAMDGTKVRSKSEALIYNQLMLHGITFVYEMPMMISGRLMHPDFVIYCEDGRLLIWEHQGRMDLEQYRREHSDKLSLYMNDGYVPDINLLLSYEDKQGNIDTMSIEKKIQAFILS